jgi:quercetin dioxygenase-like cupin family protein
MKRIALALWLALALIVSTRFTGAQAPPTAPIFIGKVDALDAKDISAGRRHFEAGARTAWHSHDKGQLLFMEKGRGRAQRRGEPIRDLKEGESEYTAPDVVHWHGAAPDHDLVQVNIGFGGGTKWFEKVTDEEYNGKKK